MKISFRKYQEREIIVLDLSISVKNDGDRIKDSINTTIMNIEMLGDESIVYVDAKEAQDNLAVKVPGKFTGYRNQDLLKLFIDLDDIHIFDKESELRIF